MNHKEMHKRFEKLIPADVDILHEIKSDRIFCSREAVVGFIESEIERERERIVELIEVNFPSDNGLTSFMRKDFIINLIKNK